MSNGETTSWIAAAAMLAMAIVMVFAFGFRALTPLRWVELCLGGGQLRHVFYEVLGCPHASDYTADAFLVANPVVLEALWSGSELGRFHGLHPCCPKE